MRKKRKPRILTFVILTTLTILTWAAFDIWRAFSRPVPTEVDPKIIEELDPNIDPKAIQEIRDRRFFSDEEARDFGSKLQPSSEELPQATESTEQ